MEKIENIVPYEFVDKYVPNKHGIIFKEHIYSPDLVYSTFALRLVEGVKSQLNTVSTPRHGNLGQSSNNPDKKNVPKKDAQNTVSELEIKDLTYEDNVKVIVELFKDNKLIYSDIGYNQIVIRNIILEGSPYIPPEDTNKKKDKDKDKANQPLPVNLPQPYLLIFRLEQSEMPSFMKVLINIIIYSLIILLHYLLYFFRIILIAISSGILNAFLQTL